MRETSPDPFSLFPCFDPFSLLFPVLAYGNQACPVFIPEENKIAYARIANGQVEPL